MLVICILKTYVLLLLCEPFTFTEIIHRILSAHAHTHMHTHTHACTHICTHLHMYRHVTHTHTQRHTYTHTHTHSHSINTGLQDALFLAAAFSPKYYFLLSFYVTLELFIVCSSDLVYDPCFLFLSCCLVVHSYICGCYCKRTRKVLYYAL